MIMTPTHLRKPLSMETEYSFVMQTSNDHAASAFPTVLACLGDPTLVSEFPVH